MTINQPCNCDSYAEANNLGKKRPNPNYLGTQSNNARIHNKACHARNTKSKQLVKLFIPDHTVLYYGI